MTVPQSLVLQVHTLYNQSHLSAPHTLSLTAGWQDLCSIKTEAACPFTPWDIKKAGQASLAWTLVPHFIASPFCGI